MPHGIVANSMLAKMSSRRRTSGVQGQRTLLARHATNGFSVIEILLYQDSIALDADIDEIGPGHPCGLIW